MLGLKGVSEKRVPVEILGIFVGTCTCSQEHKTLDSDAVMVVSYVLLKRKTATPETQNPRP